MAKPTAPKEARVQKRIPALEGGMVQHREGVERCGGCNGEVVIARTIDGIVAEVTPVLGERHICSQPQA